MNARKLSVAALLALGLGLWIFGPMIFRHREVVGGELIGRTLPAGAVYEDSEKKVEVSSLLSGSQNLLSFWAEWCAPCVDEMPRIQASREALKAAGINLILVNVDQGIPEKIYQNMRAWLTAQKLTLSTFYDFNAYYLDLLKLPGLPAHIGVDDQQKVIWVEAGQIDWDSARIKKRF